MIHKIAPRKFILRLLLSFLLLPFITVAQEELKRQEFVRVGIDLSRFALPYINEFGPSGLEFSLDTEIKYNYFPTIEAGFSKVKDYTDVHEYDSDGSYFRVGLNYGVTKYKHRLDRSIFFVGARYGYSGFSHQSGRISVDNQWGSIEASFPKTDLSAHWIEGVIGLRGEMFKNFYMGYTIRVKSWISHTHYGSFTPYWIPGYGKATKKIAFGMSYSVFYAIPLKKLKLDFEE